MAALGITSFDIEPTPSGVLDSRFPLGNENLVPPVLGTPVKISTTALDVPLVADATSSVAITSYSLERSLTGTSGWSEIASGLNIFQPGNVYHDTGLSQGTDYYYRANATNANTSVSAYSDVVHGVTDTVVEPPPDPIEPGVPINWTLTPVSSSRIDHDWEPNPIGGTPTSYELYRATSLNGTYALVYGGTAPSFNDTGLVSGTYYYRLWALKGVVKSVTYAQGSQATIGTTQAAAFRIKVTDTSFNGASAVPVGGGAARKVQPGEVIEIDAGTHPRTMIRNVVGTAQNPIIIRGPQTGTTQAIFRAATSPGSGTCLGLEACRFFKLDGSSTTHNVLADGKRHSIKLMYATNASSANKDGTTHWLKFSGSGNPEVAYNVTRDCTIRYIEIDGGWSTVAANNKAGNSGIGLSTNDHSFKERFYSTAWQENVILEHNYVHNVSAEGGYLGPNAGLRFAVDANHSQGTGADVPIRHWKVRYNFVADTGGAGLSCKSWFGGTAGGDGPTENSIHHNVLLRINKNLAQNGRNGIGMQSVNADCYCNYIEDVAHNPNIGDGNGINLHVEDGTPASVYSGANQVTVGFNMRLYNNVIRRIDDDGITVRRVTGNNAYPGQLIAKVYNNTIYDADNAVAFKEGVAAQSFIKNNIAWNITAAPFSATAGTVSSNTTGSGAGKFVNTGLYPNADFHLQAGDLASGTVGVDIAPTDFEGDARSGGTADKGAYEYP